MATVAFNNGDQSILSCFSNCNTNSGLGHFHHQMPLPGMQKKPAKRAEIQQTEDILASGMQRLTVQERCEAMDDIHCVGEELQETPEMIASSLREFEELVQKENNPIYQMAAAQNKAYVEDPAFRLKFLRANLHNVHCSVRQMMNFLRYKAEYFGNEKVARDITLEDLNEQDMIVIKSGLFHMQDGRDRTGRVIIYMFNTLLGKFKAENLIRAVYYIWFNVMIPLPEVQMKGLVGVYLDVAKPGEKIPIPGFNFMLTVMNFTCSLPMRYSGMHLCVKGSDKSNLVVNNAILGLAMNGFPQYARVRCRLHYGSLLELQYQLKSYGLPIDTCPVDTSGNIRWDILNAWFEQHTSAMEQVKTDDFLQDFQVETMPSASSFTLVASINNEQDFLNPRISDEEEIMDSIFAEYDDGNDVGAHEQAIRNETAAHQQDAQVIPLDFDHDFTADAGNSDNGGDNQEEESRQRPDNLESREAVITHPSPDDVLLGRGRDIQNHQGNVRFRKFLEPYSHEYDHAPRSKRRKIAVQMNEILGQKGIRFLKPAGLNEWVESDAVSVEKKIAQLFRSLRKKK